MALKLTSPIDAIVIHSRPYGEGREIVEFLTESRGKIAGVRRLSKRNGFQRLQPFTIGHLSLTGRSSLLTVSSFDFVGRFVLIGDRVASGFYILELLQKLIVEGEPDSRIYRAVYQVLDGLSGPDPMEPLLRVFELEFLSVLGYGINFDHEGFSGEKIYEEKFYCFMPEQGFYEVNAGSKNCILGKDILAVSNEMVLTNEVALNLLKKIVRNVIDSLLNGKLLTSRKLIIKRPVKDK